MIGGGGMTKFDLPAFLAQKIDPAFFGHSDFTPGAVVEELKESPNKSPSKL